MLMPLPSVLSIVWYPFSRISLPSHNLDNPPSHRVLYLRTSEYIQIANASTERENDPSDTDMAKIEDQYFASEKMLVQYVLAVTYRHMHRGVFVVIPWMGDLAWLKSGITLNL